MGNFDEYGGLDFDSLYVEQDLPEFVLYVVVAADIVVDYVEDIVVDVVVDGVVDIVVDIVASNDVLPAVPPILVEVDVLLAPGDTLYFFQFDGKLHICMIKIEKK